MVPRNAYAYIAVGLATLWPCIMLIWAWPLALVIPLTLLSIVLFIFVWKRVSSQECTLLLGFEVISTKLASGCANISILYLPPFLMIVYLICLFYAIVSTWSGKTHAQTWWLKFIYKFVDQAAVVPSTDVSPYTSIDLESTTKLDKDDINSDCRTCGFFNKEAQIKGNRSCKAPEAPVQDGICSMWKPI
jgi:hypothetical protein